MQAEVQQHATTTAVAHHNLEQRRPLWHREEDKRKITISLGRNTPMMALLSERTRGVIIQIAYTTYLFTIVSFVRGLIGLCTGGYMLTERFGIRFEGLLALIFV